MIVLDTPAILAILFEEEAASFSDRIRKSGGAMVSAGTAAVASRDDDLFSVARAFLNEPFISVEPLDAGQAVAAGHAYRRYGKGRHPASLNLGDVFSYALAQEKDLPLLFKGEDFSRTDIKAA